MRKPTRTTMDFFEQQRRAHGCTRKLLFCLVLAVLAHEFSHILNGDMRLNLRLLGAVHGMLSIRSVGIRILGLCQYIKGWIVFVLLATGGVFMLAGSVGTFFSRLIKAAINRQREYLADAAAVQWTHCDHGLVGALKKIGGSPSGSLINHLHAETICHMFFGTAVRRILLATHPPLTKRITRIDPSFDGVFPKVEIPSVAPQPMREKAPEAEAAALPALVFSETERIRIQAAIARVGRPSPAHLEYAAQLQATIGDEICKAVHTRDGAQAVICALLLDTDHRVRTEQIRLLKTQVPAGVRSCLQRLGPAVMKLPSVCRLPLVDLALPALRNLSRPTYEILERVVRGLIRADGRTTVFEFMLLRLLLCDVATALGLRTAPRPRTYGLRPLKAELESLLAVLASGHSIESETARQHLDLDLRPLDPRTIKLADLERALDALAQSSPGVKRRVLQACVGCIATDGLVEVREAELLRLIAASLDCPMPPFLPGERLSGSAATPTAVH